MTGTAFRGRVVTFMDQEFLYSLGVMTVAGAIFAIIGRFAKVPSIVMYLFAGLMLGPLTGLIDLEDGVELLAEVGIVLLLFLVGLELSFKKIRDVGKVAVVAGLGQVVFTAAGGYLLCWMLGFSVMESIFLATGLTFSSTVVVVKVLSDKKEMDSLYGRIAVGIFLVQDIVVVLALTMLTGLSSPDEMTAMSISVGFVKAFGGMLVLLAGVLVASQWLLPKPFAWSARSPGVLFIWSLTWCFLVVGAAYTMQLSIEIGAFLAGLSLAQLPYNHELRRRIHPLMDFFVALFFVSLGVRMDPSGAFAQWGAVLVLSLFVLIGNPLIFYFIIGRMGYGSKISFLTSVTVAQISEFSFIFAAMGVTSGLVSDEILSVTAMVGVITMAASAYMIFFNSQMFRGLEKIGVLRWPGAPRKDPEEAAAGDDHALLENHVIVIGMNTLGRTIVKQLCEKGETVLAIDTDPWKLKGLHCHKMLGDVEFLAALEAANFRKAKLLVSALQIEDTNELLAFRAHEAGITSAVLGVDLNMLDNLLAMDVGFLIIPKIDGMKRQTAELQKMGLLGK